MTSELVYGRRAVREALRGRREVLHALEIAPRFQRAQELLLRLHDARAGSTNQ